MFSKIIKVFEEELERLEKEYARNLEEGQKLEEKRIAYEEKAKYIRPYLKLLKEQKEAKNNIVFCILSAILLGLISFTGYSIVHFLSLISVFVCGYDTSVNVQDLMNTKKEIKQKYSDLSGISETEFLNEKKLISQKINEKEAVCNHLLNEINQLKVCIAGIDTYAKSANKPYYDEYSKKEFENYIQFLHHKLLETSLNENDDYSKVHFNHNIGTEIEYTEKPKQFIKKYK